MNLDEVERYAKAALLDIDSRTIIMALIAHAKRQEQAIATVRERLAFAGEAAK